jgi:putative transposase
MGHSYICNRVHVVFSTQERMKQIPKPIQPRLWAFMSGVARNHDLPVHALNGIEDHVHILMSVPGTINVSKAVQILKANSSKWMRQNGVPKFAWQEGFGAFSVSESNLPTVVRYIENQEAHHRKQTFEDEFIVLLKRHNVSYDARYVFG